MIIAYGYFNIWRWNKDCSTQNETAIPIIYIILFFENNKDEYKKLPEHGKKCLNICILSKYEINSIHFGLLSSSTFSGNTSGLESLEGASLTCKKWEGKDISKKIRKLYTGSSQYWPLPATGRLLLTKSLPRSRMSHSPQIN